MCMQSSSSGTHRAVEARGHWETLTQLPACDAWSAGAISPIFCAAVAAKVLKSQCLELLEECSKAEQLASMQ